MLGARRPDLAGGRTLIELFEATALRRADATAVVDPSGATSYAELDARADRLAERLRAEYGVQPEDVVGIHAGRDVRFVVGMLAAMKAGAAYLPLDPGYPRQRLQFMVKDSGAVVVVGDEAEAAFVRSLDGVALVDSGGGSARARVPGRERAGRPTDGNAAYVIYTSGTTGRPKGVVVEHRNVVGLFEATRELGFDERDIWSAVHSFAFDFSVWELWGALLHGGRVVLAPDDVVRDPRLLARLLLEHDVSVLSQTPSAFQGLVEATGRLPHLRLVVFGGETLDLRAAERWLHDDHGDAQLVNMFGITETTIHVTSHRVTLDECAGWTGPGTPIGRPLPGASVRLLDVATQEPVRAGEVGEIWVGGFGVARGYLGRPDLTAERFILDPATDERLYRSGDLGRLGGDGALVHLGRADSQVKVRGHRIELGEVENALATASGVERAAALVVGTGAEATLVACVVPHRELAQPVRKLAELQAGGTRFAVAELPNGAAVVEANRGETEYLYEEIYVRRTYQSGGIRIPDGAVVFDVGANIGIFTMWAAERASDVSVFSFEPLPPTFELLEANLGLHGVAGAAFRVAIGAEEHETTFMYFPSDTIFSGRYAGSEERSFVAELLRRASPELSESALSELLDDRMRSESHRCVVRPLSAVIAEAQVPRIDLLKIDVEKGEHEVLDGISRAHWPMISQVVIEAHDHTAADRLCERLRGEGFDVATREDEVLPGLGLTKVFARRPVALERSTPPRLPAFRGPTALAASIRRELGDALPSAAVPSRVEFVNALPLTTNGKLDRARLAASLATAFEEADDGTFASKTETRVAEVFADVLHRPDVTRDSHFFQLGGQSLTAVAAVQRLRRHFGDALPLQLLFERPRVADLATAVDEGAWREEGPDDDDRDAAASADPAALTDAEGELWVHQRMYPRSSALNVSRTLTIARPWSPSMPRAAAAVLSGQPTFRQVFGVRGGAVRKSFADACVSPFVVGATTDDEWAKLAARATAEPFDLARQVPIRVYLAEHAADSTTRALVVMHHVATDRVSMDLLVDNLAAALAAAAEESAPAQVDAVGKPSLLAPRRSTRSDAYWSSLLAATDPLPLPGGRERIAWAALDSASIAFELRTPALDELAEDGIAVTPNVYLLAAFAGTLHELLDAEVVAIGIPHEGRDESTRHERGCFVTTAPVWLARALDTGELLRSAQRQILAVLEHGAPARDVARRLQPPGRLAGHNPLFQVVFAYHEQPIDRDLVVDDVAVSVCEIRPRHVQFDLDLVVERVSPTGFKAWLAYRQASFRPDEAQLVVKRIQTVARDLAARIPVQIHTR